jgi:hypothetical protein
MKPTWKRLELSAHMINCFQFCSDFAFKFDLCRYNLARMSEEAPTEEEARVGAYTRPLFGAT